MKAQKSATWRRKEDLDKRERESESDTRTGRSGLATPSICQNLSLILLYVRFVE